MTRGAEADLERLFDYVFERELHIAGGDPTRASEALDAIRRGLDTLRRSPFTCRKAGEDALLRELLIPFANSGYVALFEIVERNEVMVMAVRHQLEEDYH